MGYINFWQLINAKDMGVPQNRLRVFMVSILKEATDPSPSYRFPSPIPLDKDVESCFIPEEEIEDSYYIPHERVTDEVLLDLLDQPNVYAALEQLYYREKERQDDSDSD